jgi:PH (Pleckstrin Homology) domain-containing protein
MDAAAPSMRFGLAPMCRLIRVMTIVIAALPAVFLIAGALGPRILWSPALVIIIVYAWVWTRFRPTAFVVRSHALEVIWPLKATEISRDQITAVRLVDRQELRQQVGWGMRVGAGGLWGGFGWLWTSRRGIVQMYVSRLDGFVWIERGAERPWLITPERPDAFVRALT